MQNGTFLLLITTFVTQRISWMFQQNDLYERLPTSTILTWKFLFFILKFIWSLSAQIFFWANLALTRDETGKAWQNHPGSLYLRLPSELDSLGQLWISKSIFRYIGGEPKSTWVLATQVAFSTTSCQIWCYNPSYVQNRVLKSWVVSSTVRLSEPLFF